MGQYCTMCRGRAGGTETCQKLFEEVLAQEYTNPDYGAVHLMAVDCYALQHSEIHRPHSNAFHLLRLGWMLLRDGDPKIGKTDLDFKRYARDLRRFPYLEPPKDRGNITVADVARAKSAKVHKKTVRAWADCVWRAWSGHHLWVQNMLSDRPPR